MKRTPLRRVSNKRKGRIEEGKEQRKKDHLFYQEIWEKRPHVCYESGQPLGEEALTVYFHHVLPKEKYEEYRYKEWNIVLLSFQVHSSIEVGGMDKAPKVKELYLELYEKYHNFTPLT